MKGAPLWPKQYQSLARHSDSTPPPWTLQAIEQLVLEKKKADLMAKYASDSLRKEQVGAALASLH